MSSNTLIVCVNRIVLSAASVTRDFQLELLCCFIASLPDT